MSDNLCRHGHDLAILGRDKRGECKACGRARHRATYTPERRAARYAAHRTEELAASRAYNAAHRVERAEYAAAYNARHPERLSPLIRFISPDGTVSRFRSSGIPASLLAAQRNTYSPDGIVTMEDILNEGTPLWESEREEIE